MQQQQSRLVGGLLLFLALFFAAATVLLLAWLATVAVMRGNSNKLYLYNPEEQPDSEAPVHELLQVGARSLLLLSPSLLANFCHVLRIFQSEGEHPSFLFEAEGSSSPGPRVIEFYAPW